MALLDGHHAERLPESVDTFNNPHFAVPARESAVTRSFPAEAYLALDGAGRDAVVAAATAI